VCAGRQLAELEWTEADPLQLQHTVADVFAHALDLALAALVDRDLEGVGFYAGDARRRGHPILELDSVAERPQRRLVHRGAAHNRTVGLVHLEARVRQAMREVAVVSQQDQPGGVGVKAADRVEPLRRPDQ
jgi:hypothetical protein